ncbi:MAG: type II toxin-antitoxin system Phd/YefM family antitoxin [Chloroflexi bacterium]|nr:type II toxin-antitoxin system Phd/YefM family antitoxin [Chloroflexota bacterium]
MTKTAEAQELAKRLSEFLDEVKAGHEVLVLRGQEPVARLVPITRPLRSHRRSALHLTPLPGRWTGEAVLRSGDLAEEMFARP